MPAAQPVPAAVPAQPRARRSRALQPVTSPPASTPEQEVEPAQAFHDWTPWSSAMAANA